MSRTMKLTILLLLTSSAAPSQSIYGFLNSHTEQQRALEKKFLELPRAENCERYLFALTEEPHPAGSEGDWSNTQYVDGKLKEFGFETRIDEYYVYLPIPVEISVNMLEPDTMSLTIREPGWAWDKDSYDSRALLPFNAYSPSGEVTAQVVYVNRGLREDYDVLEGLGVDVRGRIVLARYGGSYRGVKAKVAEEHGAAGLIIYSDPADDGYMKGDIYPRGPMRPWDAIQRGSVQYIFEYPGDPLTPGYAAKKDAKRLKPQEAENLPKIITTPISYGDAQNILKNLAGPPVPSDSGWQGGLPFTYHVGPGPAKVHMSLQIDFEIRPIWNNVGIVRGTDEPEKKIIIGNHRDAWVYGAVDPNSGTSAVLETARSLGELRRSGWNPRRTVEFHFWDGEEYGLLGSTEWVEEAKADLSKNGVVYINIDSAVSGDDFNASAVPSLDEFIRDITREVNDPKTQEPIFGRWWKHQNTAAAKKFRGAVPDTATVRVGRLGSGSDYTAFLNFAGVSSIDLGFSGPYGVYHSILDNFYWMKQWGDPTFEYHATASKIAGLLVLRYSEADVYPCRYEDYAETIIDSLDKIEKELRDNGDTTQIDLRPARERASEWKSAAGDLTARIKAGLHSGNLDRSINQDLLQIERDLMNPAGLPGRTWFKHQVFAPGTYTGYATKLIPGVAEAIDRKDWSSAGQQLIEFERALERAIATTRKASALLQQ